MEEETTELREHASRLVSDSITKAKEEISAMAGDKNQRYGPPTIPETPSKTINDMLKLRCDKQFDNPIKFGIVFYVCAVFSLITKVYGILHADRVKSGKASHSMWMVACGIVGALVIVKSYLIYNVMMACSFIAHFILYYICVIFALVGMGLGISGMLFFDKQAVSSISSKISSTFQSSKSSIASDKKMG